MAKTIWDYPVKYPYGYSSQYFGGTIFHNGEDRPVPGSLTNVPVTVNGVTIGITGTTGNSTGIHLHVGKFVAFKSFNPNGGGAKLSNAKVITVDNVGATSAGKFVRVQSGIYSWVYLHLSKITCKVGDKLIAEDKEEMITRNGLKVIYKFRLGRAPSEANFDNFVGKKTFDWVDKYVTDSKEYANEIASFKAGKGVCKEHLPSVMQQYE